MWFEQFQLQPSFVQVVKGELGLSVFEIRMGNFNANKRMMKYGVIMPC
jgi:hypothetical protein